MTREETWKHQSRKKGNCLEETIFNGLNEESDRFCETGIIETTISEHWKSGKCATSPHFGEPTALPPVMCRNATQLRIGPNLQLMVRTLKLKSGLVPYWGTIERCYWAWLQRNIVGLQTMPTLNTTAPLT